MLNRVLIVAVLVMAVFMTAAVGQEKAPITPTPSLKIVSPANGEKWDEGSTRTVEWSLVTSAGMDSLQIMLIAIDDPKEGAKMIPLVTFMKDNPDMPGIRKWEWVNIGPTAPKTKLQITAFLAKAKPMVASCDFIINPSVTDEKAAGAPIAPPPIAPAPISVIKILAPNGGEMLEAGSGALITWGFDAPAKLLEGLPTFRIFLSRDGGKSFGEKIATGISAGSPKTTKEFKWEVPKVPGDMCIIKISLVAKDGKTLFSDVSDKMFAIVKPTTTDKPDVQAKPENKE